MAIKTFTTGEVLTAADTNTYLANSGLVYVASATLTAASVISVNNCFSSTYDNYRIIFEQVSPSLQTDTRFNFSTSGAINSTANYWMSNTFIAGTSISVNEESSQTSFRLTFTSGGSNSYAWVDIISPFASANTNMLNQSLGYAGAIINRNFIGFFNASTSFDGFKLTPSSGGTVAAKVSIYGYRKV